MVSAVKFMQQAITVQGRCRSVIKESSNLGCFNIYIVTFAIVLPQSIFDDTSLAFCLLSEKVPLHMVISNTNLIQSESKLLNIFCKSFIKSTNTKHFQSALQTICLIIQILLQDFYKKIYFMEVLLQPLTIPDFLITATDCRVHK